MDVNTIRHIWRKIVKSVILNKKLASFSVFLLRIILPRNIYMRIYWNAKSISYGLDKLPSFYSSIDIMLGIIEDPYCAHKYIVYACNEMRIKYKLINIHQSNWIDVIRNSGCIAYLVTPRYYTSDWRLMYDEKLKIIEDNFNLPVFPKYEELWMYESKRRMHYWLEAEGFPHPKTFIFYDYDEAMNFAKNTNLPIVAKTELGFGAKGIKILNNKADVVQYVKRCFNKGHLTINEGLKNIEWGFVIFQEYLPDAKEWRMLRIGNSYFGHLKLKNGQFHSGSGLVGWYDPAKELLELTYNITEKGGYQSMNIDVFETQNGQYLVNELQALIGSQRPYQMLINGKAGRYLFDLSKNEWNFEEGDYCRNLCWNLRLQTLLEKLGYNVPLYYDICNSIIDDKDKEASIKTYLLNK